MKRLAVLLLCTTLQGEPVFAGIPGDDTGHLLFNPTFILPRSGTARPLYGVTYFLLLTKDSIAADLPYEGRAWSVNINPPLQGIRFVSKQFSIRKSRSKRGIQFITVEPKDAGDIHRITLSIPYSGETTIQVFSDRRDAVAFTGAISRQSHEGKR